MRRLFVPLVLLASLASAQEADLASLFHDDTFVYLEADAATLEKGVRELDLARLLSNPKYKDFLRPTFGQLGLDPERPIESLFERFPVRDFLKGRLAVGIRGFTLRLRSPDGKEAVLEVTPGKPIDATFAHRVLGFVARAQMAGAGPGISVDADVLIVAEPGPRAREALLALGVVTQARVGDEQVTKVDLSRLLGPQAPSLYADLGEERWILGTTLASIRERPRSPLVSSERFAAVRRRMAGEGRVLFGYADVAGGARMLEGFVPPIVAEAARMNGLASLRGLGLGVSLAEGGVRESVGIVLDGDPKGVWRVLDAHPPGLRSIEIAPPDAIGVFAAKLDPALLVTRIEETAALLLPGTEDLLRPEIQRAFAQVGIDAEKEILGAIGDEIALVVFPPEGLAPSFAFGLEVRDEEAFRGLLAKVRGMIPQDARVRIVDVPFEEGIPAYQVLAPLPMRPPVFAVHKGHLFGASDPARLAQVVHEWGKEGAKSLARDGEVFGHSLRGLGGRHEELVALAWVDLRALTGILGNLGQIRNPAWFDAAYLPDMKELAGHLHGAAVGVRRGGEGVTLDLFTPTGVLVPAAIIAISEAHAYDPAREMEELRLAAAAQDPEAPFWGIESLVSDGDGVQILGVFEGAPAAKAGLQAGDVVYRIGDAEVKTFNDLRRATLRHKPGDTVRVAVRRGVEEIILEVVFARRGDHQQ